MPSGSGAYLGFGYDIAKNIPGPITNYVPFQTENIDPKWRRKENPNLNPRRSAKKGRLLMVDIKGSVKGAPDSESIARLRAHMQGKDTPTTLAAGAYQHVLTPIYAGDAPETIYRKTLSGVIYRDDGVPLGVMGGVATKASWNIKEGDYVELTHDLMFANTTESENPADDAAANNAAFTGDLYVRGVRRDPESTDPVYVRVTTAGALDGSATPKVKFKVGGLGPTDVGYAAQFTGAEYLVVLDKWMDVFDAATPEEPMGVSLWNPYQVLFHTDDDTDVLTVADTWTIAPTITVLSAPTYTSREVYDYGQASALVDDDSYVWKTVGVECVKPLVDDRGIGSYFMQQALDNGNLEWNITLERNYVDRKFVNALKAGGVADFKLAMSGARIGSTDYRDFHGLHIPNAQYDEAGTAIANANALQEKVVLKGFDDGTNPICTETIINTIDVI